MTEVVLATILDSPGLQSFWNHLVGTAAATLAISAAIGVPIVLTCWALVLLSGWQNRRLMNSFGWRGLLFTGWLGTPVHEFSHLVVALLFGHRIEKVRFFEPDPSTGQLGYVQHSYNRRNPYAAILGNAAIPIAPFFGGSLVLLLLTHLLMPALEPGGELLRARAPRPVRSLDDLSRLKPLIQSARSFARRLKKNLQQAGTWKNWQIYVYLYSVFCIAMHLAPSRADFKNFWSPFALILVILFVVHFIARYSGDVSQRIINTAWPAVSALTGLLLLSVILSAAGTAFVFAVTALAGKRTA